MRNLLFLIFTFSFSLTAFSQQHWYASRSPNDRDINSVKLFNHDTIVLVGGWHIVSSFQTVTTPALFKSTTSGLGLWNVANVVGNNDDWLKSVDFTDAQNGIAVGWKGQIITTTNGGDSWNQISSPVNRDFNKLFFINSQQMIIVGGKQPDTAQIAIQTILRTINGGQTWYPVIDQPGIWLKSVHFPTPTLGYAVGDSGTILKSTNAGTSWTPVAAPIQRDFNAIWFTDVNNGFIVGGNLNNDSIRTILQTTDGGNTWTINKDELGGWLNDVHFLDTDTGYAVGDRATVLKTTDGGQTWAQIIIPGTAGDEYFSTVRFYSWDFGFIAGRWGVQYTYNQALAPEAYTSGTDVLDTTQVILNGFVNSHGFASVYSFLFSNDNFATTQFETPYPGYVQSNVFAAASYGLPNAWLTPNTTYQYLIKAWSLGGTAYGDTLSFFTGTAGSEIKTLPASNVTDTSITLNGTIRGFSMPMNLFFEFNTTPSLGNQIAATPAVVNDTALQTVTANLQGLQPLTFYYYRLKGVSGTSIYYGGTYSFFTLGNAFTSLETYPATTVTDSAATLNGFIEGFKYPVTVSFDYSPNFDFNFSAYPSSSNYNDSLPHSISAYATSLLPGTLYYFRIKAQTSIGTYYGDTVAFYTDIPVLKTLAATNVTQSSARLNGNISRFGIPVSLSFEYGNTELLLDQEVFATPLTVNDTFPHDVAATVSGLQNNTLYYYRLKAETTNGAKFYGDIRQLYTGSSSIPNWDFQYWRNATTPVLYHWTAVTDYIDRVPGHSGNYAIKVFNQNMVMLGQANFRGSAFLFSGGVPFSARPDSMSAWFKYDFPPNDTAGMLVALTNQSNIVSQTFCKVSGSTGGEFIRIAFKIDYVSSLTPDSLVMVILCGKSRDTMIIDDISFSPSSPAVPNADFETWTDYHHHRLQSWEYLQMFSSDSVQNNRLKVVKQTYFDQSSQDYAAEITNIDMDGQGHYMNGNISTSLGILGSPPPSFPVYAKHISLNGWFKYYPVNGDTMVITIWMMKGGQSIGEGYFYYSDSVTQFQSFDLPIIYPSSGLVPDSAIISISPSNHINHGLSRLEIDKLSFDGIVSDVEEINFLEHHSISGITIFPNPTSSVITFQLSNGQDGTIEMYDLSGKLMLSNKFTGNKIDVDVSGFVKGLYLIKVLSGGKIINSKFIVLK